MKLILIISVCMCIAGCNATNLVVAPVSPPQEVKSTAEAPIPAIPITSISVKEEPSKVNCGNPDTYGVLVVAEEKRTVNITADGRLIKAIEVPWQIDSGVSGFSLNWAKKTKSGFEISIEYGSRYYYNKRLIFVCKKDGFYLTSIEVDSHDHTNPENGTTKTLKVKPSVPLGEFHVMNYTRQ